MCSQIVRACCMSVLNERFSWALRVQRVYPRPLSFTWTSIVRPPPRPHHTLHPTRTLFCFVASSNSTPGDPNTMSLAVDTLTADQSITLESLQGTIVLSPGTHSGPVRRTSPGAAVVPKMAWGGLLAQLFLESKIFFCSQDNVYSNGV